MSPGKYGASTGSRVKGSPFGVTWLSTSAAISHRTHFWPGALDRWLYWSLDEPAEGLHAVLVRLGRRYRKVRIPTDFPGGNVRDLL